MTYITLILLGMLIGGDIGYRAGEKACDKKEVIEAHQKPNEGGK